MKLKKILGITAAVSTIAYLYLSARESGNDGLEQLEGLDIKLNPEVLIDAAVKRSKRIPGQYKDRVAHIGKNFVNGLMGRN